MGVYIWSAQAQRKGRPRYTAKYQVKNCACEDASRAGQRVSYRISKLFSPEDTPRHEGAAHRHNVPVRPHATGRTSTDPTRPPRPNAPNSGTSQPLGGADDGVPAMVMPATQQPHARRSRDRAHWETTSSTGNKRCRDNYSDQTRPAEPIRATTQPRRVDHRRTNAGDPTPHTGHAPGSAHTPQRTDRLPQPSEPTG